MATSLSPNLKLRISDDLTSDAKYNLDRIDTLAGIFSLSLSADTLIRSIRDISILPRDPSRGGDGTPGTVTLATSDQPLGLFKIYSSSVSFSTSIGLEDQAVGGTKKLNIKYKSDLSGLVDTGSDRVLSVDLNGGDRGLTLGGDFSLSGSLSLISPFNQILTLPSNYGSNGQVLTTDGAGELSWTTVSGGGGVTTEVSTWTTADGTTKTVNHSLSSQNIAVEVLDVSNNYSTIRVDEISRPSNSQIQLTASSAPSSSWIILLHKVI